MVCCKSLLILVVLVSVSSGKPVDKHRVNRDASGHQSVDVPDSTFFDQLQDHRAKVNSESHNPPSEIKVHEDDNDLPEQSIQKKKPMLKPTELKKNPSGVRKSPKKGKKSNHELLHHLGMTKLKSPAINHHRKRLASQSRKTHHQKSSGDSKMFVIKLPPNPYYYAHHRMNGVDTVEAQPKPVPVNFNTNGKPSRVYHWNIPTLKKMVARKAGSSAKSAIFADSDIFNIDKQATWNETDDDKSFYRKASFYAPKKQPKHTFRKYYYGNGKPHSFYVMDKSKRPSAVHRLLP